MKPAIAARMGKEAFMGKRRDRKDSAAPEPRRDQLDDQGRQQHIGHGDGEEPTRRRPFDDGQDEGLGQPVRIGGKPGTRGEEEPESEWEDRTEGTSRQTGL